MSRSCPNSEFCGNAYCMENNPRCRARKDYAPIVPGHAKGDGTGRISAYDTTWPDVHAKQHSSKDSQ